MPVKRYTKVQEIRHVRKCKRLDNFLYIRRRIYYFLPTVCPQAKDENPPVFAHGLPTAGGYPVKGLAVVPAAGAIRV